jgi:hypothetical protein
MTELSSGSAAPPPWIMQIGGSARRHPRGESIEAYAGLDATPDMITSWIKSYNNHKSSQPFNPRRCSEWGERIGYNVEVVRSEYQYRHMSGPSVSWSGTKVVSSANHPRIRTQRSRRCIASRRDGPPLANLAIARSDHSARVSIPRTTLPGRAPVSRPFS